MCLPSCMQLLQTRSKTRKRHETCNREFEYSIIYNIIILMSTNNGSLVMFCYSEFHAPCAIIRQTIFKAVWPKHNGNLRWMQAETSVRLSGTPDM